MNIYLDQSLTSADQVILFYKIHVAHLLIGIYSTKNKGASFSRIIFIT